MGVTEMRLFTMGMPYSALELLRDRHEALGGAGDAVVDARGHDLDVRVGAAARATVRA